MNAHAFNLPGYVCRPVADTLTQVITPFTYGHDSQSITFFVDAHARRWRLSDHGNAAYHAEAHGCRLTQKRWERLQAMLTGAVTLTPRWELRAETDRREQLPALAADLVAAALRLTADEMTLKAPGMGFTHRIEAILAPLAGERLRRGARLTGASGHRLEIPFAINAPILRLVQPVSASHDDLDWSAIYRIYGKLADIKQAGPDDTARFVILDDAGETDPGGALTLLSDVAAVLPFSQRAKWLPRLVA
ncbi:DUF1828 domain-containing protein [Thiocystis violascens]|uniref:DUF1828 domain-containing protein n=1 Tax=Thiocystis violascens (strain ATCC 17096 / DSM 198 / 6111) TaxID=765911 RepID=I3Y9Y8_THIV6|nr:DUF1828 domain-containing protein [Thiocystis violascens]AFL73806.1 protein of unknown function DUF1828 [Thiocystis violascens DSM 198]